MRRSVETPCEWCDGTGWVVETKEGRQVCRSCQCQAARRVELLLLEAAIPERFRHCTLEGFKLWNPNDPTLAQAKRRTQEFVDAWPLVHKGLLFMGRCGTGKTHLAVAALSELIRRHRIRGYYVNFSELVVQLQMSMDGSGPSRGEILEPVLSAQLLVLDELGAARPTAWVMDTLYYVLNSRYMHKRVTLCTTNYTDLANRELGEESLADRLSVPVRSRLYEMCEEVRLYGEDYREHMARRRR
ncbi:MAG: ATP-binding protein [Thermoanaerobaculum sp.]|nr:ATP-binding protein [Thermoanaerobaculum sp.]MDW7966732.1 ATP-binding protein [Thermoanaerobaculum sp.]